MVLLDIEIFKVFTQDKVRCSALFSRSLAFQFPVALIIFSRNRVQLRLSVIEDVVEVFKLLSQHRVQRRLEDLVEVFHSVSW